MNVVTFAYCYKYIVIFKYGSQTANEHERTDICWIFCSSWNILKSTHEVVWMNYFYIDLYGSVVLVSAPQITDGCGQVWWWYICDHTELWCSTALKHNEKCCRTQGVSENELHVDGSTSIIIRLDVLGYLLTHRAMSSPHLALNLELFVCLPFYSDLICICVVSYFPCGLEKHEWRKCEWMNLQKFLKTLLNFNWSWNLKDIQLRIPASCYF